MKSIVCVTVKHSSTQFSYIYDYLENINLAISGGKDILEFDLQNSPPNGEVLPTVEVTLPMFAASLAASLQISFDQVQTIFLLVLCCCYLV